MKGFSRRMAVVVLSLAVCVPLTGCIFAADLISPEFLSTLGFDPETIVPATGRVIVAFKNDTTGLAGFSALITFSEQASASGEGDVMTLTASDVEAGSTRTLVVDCPFVSVNPLGFAVETTEGLAVITYAGNPVLYGEDFSCGDIVEISIAQVAQVDGTTGYEARVRIIPGR